MVTSQAKSLHLKLIIVKWLNSEIFCTLFLPDPNLAWGGARWEKRENRGKKFGTCWEIRVIPGARSMGPVWGQTGAAYPR